MTLLADGTRDTGDILAATRTFDVADEIALLDANRYPFLGILTNTAGKDLVNGQKVKINKKETGSHKFIVYTKELRARSFTGEGTIDPDGGTLTLASGGNEINVGDVLLVTAQGWHMRVTSITSDTALVVTADVGGATGAAATAVGEVLRIGSASQQGASYRNILGTDPAAVYNYTQIFRNSAGATRTSIAEKGFLKQNDWDQQLVEIGIEHYNDIEYSFIFGERGLVAGSASTNEMTYTRGLIEWIQSNRTANVDTEAEFKTWLSAQAFKHGKKEKVLLAGANVIDMITTWWEGRVQVTQDERTFGILVNQIQTPVGKLMVINHEFLTGTTYANYAIAVDIEDVAYRYLTGSDTKLLQNRQNPGEDGRVDEYLTEAGLYLANEKRHAIMSKGSL